LVFYLKPHPDPLLGKERDDKEIDSVRSFTYNNSK
jgi:hypothetical protein